MVVEPEPTTIESKKTIVEEPQAVESKKVEPMVEEKIEPMADPATSGDEPAATEQQLDDRSKIVPREPAKPKKVDPMDTDPTGVPQLNGPNEAKREPTTAQT